MVSRARDRICMGGANDVENYTNVSPPTNTCRCPWLRQTVTHVRHKIGGLRINHLMCGHPNLEGSVSATWLGLQATALACEPPAWASHFPSQSQSRPLQLGLTWLWLKPWLFSPGNGWLKILFRKVNSQFKPAYNLRTCIQTAGNQFNPN